MCQQDGGLHGDVLSICLVVEMGNWLDCYVQSD
jgi:hypothetical protein